MLPEVISGSIGLTDVVSPIRRLCPRHPTDHAGSENIDLQNRTVTLSPDSPPAAGAALRLPGGRVGGITSFYGMPGMLDTRCRFAHWPMRSSCESNHSLPGRSRRGNRRGTAPQAGDVVVSAEGFQEWKWSRR